MSAASQADDHQRAAIALDGHGLISACPGAGKTRVLALRSARLLSTHRQGRLVAVTFTRDAARSLRERILAEAGPQHGRRVASGTFHALALNQLKRHHGKGALRVLSAREQRMLMMQAWERASAEAEFTFDRFDDACTAIESIKATLDPAPSPKTSAAGAVYATYQRLLARAGANDFADLLLRTVREMGQGALRPIQARWLLVDEAQDMDDVQYAWIAAHVKAGVEVMCVADDDQSIYQWRHALGYQGLMRFRSETGARHLTLPTNYRCRPEILAPAALLVSHNHDRVDKDIRASRGPGGAIAVLANATRWDEATRIVNHLNDTGPAGWAVLARTNRTLDAVELALGAEGIAYQRLGGEGFWEKPAAQAYLGLLKSVADLDAVALLQALRWAGLFRGPRIEVSSGEDAEALLARLAEVAPGETAGASQRAARTLKGIHRDWREAAERERVPLVAWGVAQWLAASVDERRGAVFDWCAEALCKASGPLRARVARLTTPRPAKKDAGQGVALMTMHAAKGLEFPGVWIVACEEGMIPHADSELQEERRLFYVAMTRAEDTLVLSFARDEGKPSRFIEEADLTHLTANVLPEALQPQAL